MVNNNLVPVDFLVMDVECNASCPIILGRPFLRTVGDIIDMREGTIKYQFPLKKGMEHFPRKSKKLLFDSILRANYELDYEPDLLLIIRNTFYLHLHALLFSASIKSKNTKTSIARAFSYFIYSPCSKM
jgi:hypothetical protein